MKDTFHPHAEKELDELEIITMVSIQNWEIDFVKRLKPLFHESYSSQMVGSLSQRLIAAVA